MSSAEKRRERAQRQASEQKLSGFGRAAVGCAVVSGAGMGFAAVAVLLRYATDLAAWVAASAGLLLLLSVACFGVGDRIGAHRLSILGWIGLVFGTLTALMLMGTLPLALAGHGGAASLLGALGLIPLCLAVGAVAAQYLPEAEDEAAVSGSMSDIGL